MLRFFIGKGDRRSDRLRYETIVEKECEQELARATVLRGILGFGATSQIHTGGILRLSEDLPIVIEIVDQRGRIDDFLAALDEPTNLPCPFL